ncbi:MAG: DUF7681 family protein [Vibrio sp.]
MNNFLTFNTAQSEHMDNQHRKITGYRELNQDEIDLMNQIKAKGEELNTLHDQLCAMHAATSGHAIDYKWLSEGKTDLQKGIMCWVRAVAQPKTF